MADGHDMFHHVNSLQILTQSIAKILYIFEQFFLSYSIVIQNLGFFKRIRNSSEFVFESVKQTLKLDRDS